MPATATLRSPAARVHAGGEHVARRLRSLTPAEQIAGAVALVLSVLHQLVIPNSGTDLAAQLARASFARAAPLTPVDLSWFGGVHPFGYSLLTPWIMAVLGVALSGVLASVVASVLFARLLRGLSFPITSAVLGAFFLVADVVSGRTTFALSAVALLAALLLRERRGWAIGLAVLTALLSPVGAAFLALAAAVLILHRQPGGWPLAISALVPLGVLTVLFPGGGIQPFTVRSALPAAGVAVLVAVSTRVPMVRTGAVLYGMAVVFFVVHHDPFGSNILRLGLIVAAPVMLATLRRPSPLALAGVVAVAVWQVGPLVGDVTAAPGPELRSVTAELVALHSARVEIVAPRDHRESVEVAEHVPLARGWSRQLDYGDNRLFYEGTLTGAEYVSWLRAHAVDHVALPTRATIDFGSRREAALLRRPVRGLRRVWSDRDWIVFAVVSPRAVASAPAVVVTSTRTALTLHSPVAGTSHVRVRWSRWLSISGPACVAPDGDEVTVRFHAAGTVVLGSSLAPDGHC